ncbi:MAG: TIGR02099 family protein [Gammaproteobacteria bacterium]|nr:TIGR02099 family protein [Gammaproteobacteria bacterium]MBU1491557.1 TIGR02099 family protein [Gammaproteobacteria bacterium]MBU2066552.1 TIGR02099 family protein [Gammaproteobacteria bacterium]MBU2137668.1 TIGR02099 family protein [Gammaproteobacteria bacterium]MBU2215600.1 TIGR02099 family protein [Gammaproteobacteria bacterium]
MSALARVLAAALRWGLGLCALVLVCAALYVSLGRQLAPLVAEYQQEVETRARDALGQPLRIGSLEGRWQGFAPLLIAHDVELGEGEQAVHLDQVRLVPDVLGSLLARQPRIANLELEGVRLALLQDEAGAWQLKGLPQRDDAPPPDIARVLEAAQALGRVSVLDSQLTVEPFGASAQTLTYINLSLRNGMRSQRLDGRLRLPDGQPLALQLRTRLQPQTWREAEAELYVSLPQSDWAQWLPASLTRDWRLERLQAGGDLWLSWAESQVQRVSARLNAAQVAGHYVEREGVALQDLSFNAHFQRSDQGFEAIVDDLAFSQGETRWGDVRVGLVQQRDNAAHEERWSLGVDRLDIAPLVPLVEALAPLPETARTLLATLKPHGRVAQLSLDYRPAREGAQRLQFAANLEAVGFAAYQASPAAENVSGSVQGDLASGELRLDARNFMLHLTTLFPEPWRYPEAHARLLWQLDDEAFTLRSPYLRVSGEEGEIAGDFLIRLRRDPAAEDYMDLRVGLREGDAAHTAKYLPTRSPGLSPALAEWLQTAIRGGRINQGFFQYQGSLNKGADAAARSLSLYFDVEGAELAFQPGWPVLREARGQVFVEDSGVRVRVPEGQILESRVSDVRADIPSVTPGQAPRLRLTAELQSSVEDALQILQQAPLGTAQTFADWQGSGALQGALDLDLPLRKGLAPTVVVDFAAEGASLNLPQPVLALSDIHGAFRYDTARGLSAPAIRAQLLGTQVQGKAIAEGRNGQAVSRLDANGRLPLATLTEWLGVRQALPLSGQLPYQLRLTLGQNNKELRVQSSLKGLAVDLPAPFGKAAGESRDAEWRMTFAGAEQGYWFDYANLASLAFAAPAGRIREGRGELRLGDGPAILPRTAGLWVRGRLSELDLSTWQTALEPYRSVDRGDAQQLLKAVQLNIARFSGFGTQIDGLAVDLQPRPAGWSLGVESVLTKGRIELPEADGVPIVANLDYLRLPAAEVRGADAEAVDTPDPLAEFDPRSVPALDLRIAQVMQGEQLLGAWSLKARPQADGVIFRDLDIGLKGLQLGGEAGWRGTPGATRSWYKGRLQGKALEDVLVAWGFAPTVTSESFRLDVDGNWPGSPAWVSLKRFSGSMDAALRKGQLVEVQGSAQALRVFGLLNFNSIGRRLRLDFSDLFGKGLSYDRIKGLLDADVGVFQTRTPITLTGPSSNLELNGTLDMVDQRIDAKALVTLPVTNNLPLAALIVGAPAIGGALFVVDKLLGDRVARFASVQYNVRGPLQEPDITFDKPFEKPQ